MTSETDEMDVSHLSKVKGFIEVLAKVREGDRKKRVTFVIATRRDCFEVSAGAYAASLARFSGELLPE